MGLLKPRLITRLLAGTLHHRNTSFCVLRHFRTSTAVKTKSIETDLARQLKARIKSTGPVSVSDYMKEVLTNPSAGYYMKKDVFGKDGDFTTSPEISQMFGELIGVWCVNEWMAIGKPDKIQVVELGPGRGTLSADMCRVFSQFEGIKDTVSLHLVEVSPKMTEMQEKALSAGTQTDSSEVKSSEAPEAQSGDGGGCYKESKTKYGQPVYWHHIMDTVPEEVTFFIAHEFLDALPIHKFQKREGKWHEVYVDIDEREDSPNHFRFVLAREETMATKYLLNSYKDDSREHIEVSPDSGAVVMQIGQRLMSHGGGALLIDYGHVGDKTDTLRGFKNHKLHDVLSEPGTADLTADVDFSYLKAASDTIVNTHGPICQAEFLMNMGIRERFKALMQKATLEEQKNHSSAFRMLLHPEEMGERFKFISLMPRTSEDYIPAGFKSPYEQTEKSS